MRRIFFQRSMRKVAYDVYIPRVTQSLYIQSIFKLKMQGRGQFCDERLDYIDAKSTFKCHITSFRITLYPNKPNMVNSPVGLRVLLKTSFLPESCTISSKYSEEIIPEEPVMRRAFFN